MKKILVLLFIVLAAKFSPAQQSFRECIVNTIRNMNPDSIPVWEEILLKSGEVV